MTGIRCEVTLRHRKTHEFVCETFGEAQRVYETLAQRYSDRGLPLGGAVYTSTTRARIFDARVGEEIPR